MLLYKKLLLMTFGMTLVYTCSFKITTLMENIWYYTLNNITSQQT